MSKLDKTDVGILVVLFVVLVFVGGVVNHWLYGDWTCAFKRCVKVENVK